jgi:hypothetical protein
MKSVRLLLPPRKENAHGQVYRAECPFVKPPRGSDRLQRLPSASVSSGNQRQSSDRLFQDEPPITASFLGEGTRSDGSRKASLQNATGCQWCALGRAAVGLAQLRPDSSRQARAPHARPARLRRSPGRRNGRTILFVAGRGGLASCPDLRSSPIGRWCEMLRTRKLWTFTTGTPILLSAPCGDRTLRFSDGGVDSLSSGRGGGLPA